MTDEIIKLVRPIMEDRKDSQISVVLVHGAFADGWCWSKVIPLLRAKDLNAVAVQNPLNLLADDVAATKSVLAFRMAQ